MAESGITKLPHHEQEKLCQTRPPYRQGKKLTAVKVYTVNDESQHVMVSGVPKLKLHEEVKKLFLPYGDIKKIEVLPNYPADEFTETFHIQYARIQSARIAKRFTDGKNFYGGLLHVFYAPELENILETRAKLIQRRKDVAMRLRRNRLDPTNLETDEFITEEQYHRKKKTPALPLTEERLMKSYPGETLQSIYNGIPQSIDPRPVSEPSLPPNWSNNKETYPDEHQTPYNVNDAIFKTTEAQELQTTSNPLSVGKRKNYKGQLINNKVKVRVVRPELVDTRNIMKWNPEEKNAFSNVKKVGGITIKLLPKYDDKKKIVIKDPSVAELVKPSDDLRVSIEAAKLKIRESMQNRVIK